MEPGHQSDSQAPRQQKLLKVYFDGLCPLCSREIDHYRKNSKADLIDFIDITPATFDAKSEGLDPFLVHKEMHAKRPDGTLAVGVDAFLEIWQILNGYHWLARLVSSRSLRPAANFGYSVFAAVRPYLPRRKSDCATSPYCDIRLHKAAK